MIIERADLRHGSSGTTLRDPYGRQVAALEDGGAMVECGGDYVVAILHGPPQGRYEAAGGGLTWREPAPGTTARLDIAVADATDGRFVPGLTVYVALERDGRTHAAQQCPFRWHRVMHRYATDLRVADGLYDLTVRIAAPGFARLDPVAGQRYADPVVLRFAGVRFERADQS
jgi:hypothetical protein